MRVSVVICTRNRADELARCLRSLEYQTSSGFEVLVVQGPCEDHTDNIVNQYEERIRRLRCQNPNLSEARNIGIGAATAEIVAFIDDDSVAHPKWLEQIIAAYSTDDIGGAGGLVFDHTGRKLQYRYSTCSRSGETCFDLSPPFDALNTPNAQPFLYLQGTNCSFRRKVLVAVGGFNEQFAYYHDETDLCLRIIDKGHRLVPLDGAAVYHKYAKSDIRTHARVTFDPYFPVRSQYIFALQNGQHFYTSSQLQESLRAHVAQIIAAGVQARERNDFSEDQLTYYLSRVHEGQLSGLQLSGQQPILQTFPDSDETQFLEFPLRCAPSDRLSICFMSREYPPVNYGGIGRFTYDLATGFADRGHHVHVVTDSTTIDTSDFEHGVWVHRLAHLPRACLHRMLLAPNFELISRNYRELERIHKDMSVDLVSAPLWNCEGVLAAFDSRFATVLTLMTSFKTVKELHPLTHTSDHADEMLKLEEACYRSHNLVHAISNDVLDRATTDFGPVEHSTVLYLGTKDHSIPSRTNPNDPTIRVLFVGRLERRKGVDLLLEAAAALIGQNIDVEFDLVGSDSIHTEFANQTYQHWFEEKYRGRPDVLSRVSFAGQVSEPDLHEHYANAHIFCLPSRYESFGLVLLEAMSFGLPLIAADVGGMREIVEHDVNGLLFAPENAKALADAIRRLAIASEMRNRMGRGARKTYESKFTNAVTIPRTIEHYRSVARAIPSHSSTNARPSSVVLRFAQLIAYCGGIDERQALQIAHDLVDGSGIETSRQITKRSNAARFMRFISEIPRSFGRNRRRNKQILRIVERQETDLRSGFQHLSALQLHANRNLDRVQRKLSSYVAMDREVLREMSELSRQVSKLKERLEFVRTEVLFELQAKSRLHAEHRKTPEIERIHTAGDIRLNLGCGHMPLPGYVNVDARSLPGVDLVCDVSDLPFPESSVTEIYSSHLLEHFPLEVLRRDLLLRFVRLLKPDGVFRAVVPDAECMIEAYVRREMSFEDLRTVTFGLQEYDGDFHFNMFGRKELVHLLTEAGFSHLRYTFTGRRNGLCFDMEIVGRKPT